MVGQTHTVPCGLAYFISPAHRASAATVHKSVWNITFQEELDCFDLSQQHLWIVGDTGWGVLHMGLNHFQILGVNFRNQNLVFAKFIGGNPAWHGYPADVNNRPQDRPDPQILDQWMQHNIISKPFRARIQGGRI